MSSSRAHGLRFFQCCPPPPSVSPSLPPGPLSQDGGDPAVDVSPRDLIFTLSAEAAADAVAKPSVLAGTDLRCGGVAWGDDDLALVYESWWKTRRSVIHTMSPGDPGAGKQILFDRRGGGRGRGIVVATCVGDPTAGSGSCLTSFLKALICHIVFTGGKCVLSL